jgi:hypothetical protein
MRDCCAILRYSLTAAWVLAATPGCSEADREPSPGEGWTLAGEPSIVINPVTPTFEVQGEVALEPRTGLMWDRAFQDATPERWQDPQPAVALAADYCAALDLAGYDDWRLPTRLELHSMVTHDHCRPAVDEEVFPDTPGAFRSPFWTSTSHFQGAEGLMQFAIGFHLGSVTYNGDVTSPVHARCVRSTRTAQPPATAFEIHGDIARDLRTGLEWQRRASSENVLDWDQDPIITRAAEICGTLQLDGIGWRLPTVKELNTIVDEDTVQPVIDEEVFPDTQRHWYLTSTPLGCSEHLGWYWAVSFGDGASYPPDPAYTDTAYVRCVRGEQP